MARDPYEVLGVSKKADAAEIKKAFRRLAKRPLGIRGIRKNLDV